MKINGTKIEGIIRKPSFDKNYFKEGIAVQIEYKTALEEPNEFGIYKVCVGIITQVKHDELTLEVFDSGMTMHIVGLREVLDRLVVISLLKPKIKRKRKEKQDNNKKLKLKYPQNKSREQLTTKEIIDYNF